MGRYLQVGRPSIKIKVQSLTTNSDSLKIRLIILLRIRGDRTIVGASGGRSSGVDAGWCAFAIFAIHARQGNGTGYLLARKLGLSLRHGEFGAACGTGFALWEIGKGAAVTIVARAEAAASCTRCIVK